MELSKLRKWLWAMVVVALAGYIGVSYFLPNQTVSNNTETGEGLITPEFQLTSHLGEPVNQATWRGKWLMVFFGFTNCPDVCPATMAQMTRVLEGLGADQQKFKPLFITIDPERDNEAVLAKYLTNFHPDIAGLTGTPEMVSLAVENFRAFYEKLKKKDSESDYEMAHTSAVYLVSPEGKFVRVFSFGTSVEDILKDIKKRL